jgi:hypothetical protein
MSNPSSGGNAGRIWLILPFLPLILGLGMLWQAAHGEPEHYGVRWEHTCLTHSGPAELDAMVADALDRWGETSAIEDCGFGYDIVSSYDDTSTAGWVTLDHDGSFIQRCDLRIHPGLDLSGWYGRFVPGHEVGHCLGLAHAPEGTLSIMLGIHNGWRDYDHEAIAWLYPRDVGEDPVTLHRLVAPGLTSQVANP